MIGLPPSVPRYGWSLTVPSMTVHVLWPSGQPSTGQQVRCHSEETLAERSKLSRHHDAMLHRTTVGAARL